MIIDFMEFLNTLNLGEVKKTERIMQDLSCSSRVNILTEREIIKEPPGKHSMGAMAIC